MKALQWLRALALPRYVTHGLAMADGAGAPAPIVGPMTVNGEQVSAEQLTQMVADDTAARAAGGGDAPKGSEQTDPAKPAADAKADAPKPGVLYRDGKPVPEGEYIPRGRYNELRVELEDLRKAQGEKPGETGKATDGTATAAKPGEVKFDKGKEPWAADLLPEPKEDDRDEQGNYRYATTKDFLAALARTQGHNTSVELFGRREIARQADEKVANEAKAKTENEQRLESFRTTVVPELLKREGLTADQFNAELQNLTKVEGVSDQVQGFIFNFGLRNAKAGGDFLLALGREAKTPQGLAYLSGLGKLSQEELISELHVMDRFIQKGLTAQGDPRAKPRAGNGGGNGRDLTAGGDPSTRKNISASPNVGAGASAVDVGELTGDAHFKHLEAERQKKIDQKLERMGIKSPTRR